jgi:signal transduction histidine kinase
MNGPGSFRSRLFWGALGGALGLLMLSHVLFLKVLRTFPGLFRMQHAMLASLVALALIAVGVLQVRKGLSPFDHLRARLAALREGKGNRLEGRYPAEVQPLVNDLNALLDHRERLVRRAQAKAGDLAHGLKTPLAVLTQEAERARAAGQLELAATICHQVDRMRQQVDYHLVHARAAASGATPGARCPLADSVDGLARTLRRLYADRDITIQLSIQPDHVVRAEREDLDEMLGNLLDNACKWAKSQVAVSSSDAAEAIVIAVDDDGPGLEPAKRDLVLQRGVRADEAAPGSGLGLAIVRELAELHQGAILLDASPAGGLRASLRLPRAGSTNGRKMSREEE